MRRIECKVMDEKLIKDVNDYISNNPNEDFYINLSNTVGITPDMLMKLNPKVGIRVAGGYDDYRVSQMGNDEYITFNTYTRNELINIIKKMQELESGIKPEWNEYQKLIYFYNKLKREIYYDPKFESKSSDEIRSLRGLISGQTVCAGYSMILKELMERQGIVCHYVSCITRSGVGHAFNIIEINGKNYPVDLTWDSGKYSVGLNRGNHFLACDLDEFMQAHKPRDWEKVNYQNHPLSSLDINYVDNISRRMNTEVTYDNETFNLKDINGNNVVVTQLGSNTIDGVNIYRYLFAQQRKSGEYGSPYIIYSKTNLAQLMHDKRWSQDVSRLKERAVSVLFSSDNVMDSINSKTCYVGECKYYNKDHKRTFIREQKDIVKEKSLCNKLNYKTSSGVRKDGSRFVIQKMSTKPCNVNGIEFYSFDLVEIVGIENGKPIVKKNKLFSETDLTSVNLTTLSDTILSRSHIDRCNGYYDGYIGYIDNNGNIKSNNDLVQYFKSNKNIYFESNNKKNKKDVNVISFPKFSELHDLAVDYSFEYVDIDHPEPTLDGFVCKNKKTGEVITDIGLKRKIMLAHVWINSAGGRIYVNEEVPGIREGLDNRNAKLYDKIVRACFDSIKKNNGCIDTVDILKQIGNDNVRELQVVIKLFRSQFQATMINDMIRGHVGNFEEIDKDPEPLYTESYAAGLLRSRK